MIRATVAFRHDFPDDRVEHAGKVVQAQGRNIADALARILRRLDCAVNPPDHVGERGWEFLVRYRDHGVLAQVTGAGERGTLLFRDAMYAMPFWRPRPDEIHVELLKRIEEALGRDGRFQDVEWTWRTPPGKEQR